MNSSRSLLSSPLFPTSSPSFRSSASSPSPSRTSVPMVHDSAGRASTACHYSPSLVAAATDEQQAAVHGSVSLKGEKALLEFLLDMALEQQTERGKRLKGAESEFESYLRDLQRQVIYQQAFGDKGNSIPVGASMSSLEPAASLGPATATPVTTVSKEEAFLADEAVTSATSAESNHPYGKLLGKGQVFIRSTRLRERRSRRRDAPQGFGHGHGQADPGASHSHDLGLRGRCWLIQH